MPARIDRGARFRALTTHATEIIAREGLAAATIRRLADGLGIAPNSVRHLFPSQELMLLRTAAELTSVWLERWPSPTVLDPQVRARAVVAGLIPSDSASLTRARAWAAFTALAHGDGDLAGSVRAQGRSRVRVISDEMRRLRWLALPEPRPALVTRVSDPRAHTPDEMEPDALHLLIVIAGLTALMIDHEIPLSAEAAARWLTWWNGPQLESTP